MPGGTGTLWHLIPGRTPAPLLAPVAMLEVFVVFLRLGLTSFGGPVAHLGYFRQEIVARRGWLNEAAYADLVALCQFLPGPASSQVGIALGIRRAGLPGGLAAWLGFTAPSAVLLILFAYGVAQFGDLESAGWLGGLKAAAVAVVALAVWGMAGSLCPDRPRAAIAIAATVGVLAWPTSWGQLLVIATAGIIGWAFLQPHQSEDRREQQFRVNRALAVACLVLLAVILVGAPVLQRTAGPGALSRNPAGLRQLLPGRFPGVRRRPCRPAASQGTGRNTGVGDEFGVYRRIRRRPGCAGPSVHFLGIPGNVAGRGQCPIQMVGEGCLPWGAMFLPSFLLVIGAVPFWDRLRGWSSFGGALRGINAAVVGLLLAALYDPVWTQRHPPGRGLRAGPARTGPPGHLEVATVAGGAAFGSGWPGAGLR